MAKKYPSFTRHDFVLILYLWHIYICLPLTDQKQLSNIVSNIWMHPIHRLVSECSLGQLFTIIVPFDCIDFPICEWWSRFNRFRLATQTRLLPKSQYKLFVHIKQRIKIMLHMSLHEFSQFPNMIYWLSIVYTYTIWYASNKIQSKWQTFFILFIIQNLLRI